MGCGPPGVWRRSPVEVLLIDRHNYHCFLPLLYQVAAAELEPEEIAYPVRSILWKLPNVRFVLADVKGVDLAHRVLETDGPAIPYDFLILATGSVSHFFGVPGASEYAFPLKTLEQGVALRTRILCCFERAALEPDPERRRRLLTFAIVGGGPTGVEFAGALAELVRGPLVKDYPTLDFREVRVILLEAADGLLVGLPERLRAYAFARLGRMGVEVRLQAIVAQVTREAVHLKDGTVVPAETVVWTAGVRGDSLAQAWGLPTARGGRVTVQPTLQLSDHPEVYVIGDLAHVEDGGRPLPMLAPVAMQARSGGRPEHRTADRGPGPLALPLSRPGHDGGHRAERRSGSPAGPGLHRLPRLGPLAERASPQAHRLPQSPPRPDQLGLELLLLRARRAPHPAIGDGAGLWRTAVRHRAWRQP